MSDMEDVSVFLRQPLTRADAHDALLVDAVLRILARAGATVITGTEAQTAETFRWSFEESTGESFSPAAFRDRRLALLASSQAMVIVRTELSESGAFEIAYNCAVHQQPMFFAVHQSAPIKTTLLRDLSVLCPTVYVEFEDPAELVEPLNTFLDGIRSARAARHVARTMAGASGPNPVSAAAVTALDLAHGLGVLAQGGSDTPKGTVDLRTALAEARAVVAQVGTAVRRREDDVRRSEQKSHLRW